MNKIRVYLTGVLLFATIMLVGCFASWKPEFNTVKVEKDKPIKQAVFFENEIDAVQKKSLVDQINTHIDEYNNKYGAGKAKLLDADKNLSNAKYLILEYDNIKEFGRFNDCTVFDGELLEANKSGFDLPDKFSQVTDGVINNDSSFGLNEFDSSKYRILIFDSKLQMMPSEDENTDNANYFQLSKKNNIEFVSGDVALKDSITVAPKYQSDDLSYIIYK